MSASAGPLVSVVIPVRNGSGRLQHCLDSLLHQDLPREMYEIIVADGRSTDDTADIARKYGCIVVDNPRITVAGGRNAGMAVARGRFIAFTEDDIVLPPSWLSVGVRVLEDSAAGAVGGPTPIPPASPSFARAVDLIFRVAAGTGYSVQSGISGSLREVRDIPGGNAMYRKELLEAVGSVDERLITAEDVDLHFRLRAYGSKLVFSPDFLAWHHKRDAPSRFFRQIRRFSQGRVQAGRLHGEALRPLHWRAAVLPPAVLVVMALVSPIAAMLAVLAGAAVSVVIGLVSGIGVRASLWMPVVTGLFLLAWPTGFLQELFHPTRDATGK